MAKKRKVQRKKLYARKTKREWRDRGKEFSRNIDQGSKKFSEAMERHGKRWEPAYRGFWFDTLGFIGPLVRSVIGIVFLVLAIWIVSYINGLISSEFVLALKNFLFAYIGIFFLASLFFGYARYFSVRRPRTYWLLSPIVNSLKVIYIIWILASVIGMVGAISAASLAVAMLPSLFFVFVFIGYGYEIIMKATRCCK